MVMFNPFSLSISLNFSLLIDIPSYLSISTSSNSSSNTFRAHIIFYDLVYTLLVLLLMCLSNQTSGSLHFPRICHQNIDHQRSVQVHKIILHSSLQSFPSIIHLLIQGRTVQVNPNISLTTATLSIVLSRLTLILIKSVLPFTVVRRSSLI